MGYKPVISQVNTSALYSATAGYDNIDGLSLPVNRDAWYVVIMQLTQNAGGGGSDGTYRITKNASIPISINSESIYINDASDQGALTMICLSRLKQGDTVYGQVIEQAGTAQVVAGANLILWRLP